MPKENYVRKPSSSEEKDGNFQAFFVDKAVSWYRRGTALST